MLENDLIAKTVDVTEWETSKENQKMNFGQLMEILFWKNHTQNAVEKLVPDGLIKVENISGSTV